MDIGRAGPPGASSTLSALFDSQKDNRSTGHASVGQLIQKSSVYRMGKTAFSDPGFRPGSGSQVCLLMAIEKHVDVGGFCISPQKPSIQQTTSANCREEVRRTETFIASNKSSCCRESCKFCDKRWLRTIARFLLLQIIGAKR